MVRRSSADLAENTTGAQDPSYRVWYGACHAADVNGLAAGLVFLCALGRGGASAVTVTVSATRLPEDVGDMPASVSVLGPAALATSGALTIDDLLRQVPGFSLLRRTGSRNANPTTQGATLRGAGANGASRALVMDDGVPLNDPFGGWIYWGRVPRAALERVEVLRGGASDLYGSGALAGAIDLVRRKDSGASLNAEATYGSERSADASLHAVVGPSAARVTLATEGFSTRGYVPVASEERGAVDVEADSRRESVDATFAHEPESGLSAFVRGSLYTESRGNGTPLQTNDAHVRQVTVGLDAPVSGGTVELRAYGSRERLGQTFSSIAADRSTERLTSTQEVPASALGLSLVLSRALDVAQVLVAGLDGRETRGESDEVVFASPGAGTPRASGGEQLVGGAFVEDVVKLGRLSATLGLRFDAWSDRAGFRTSGGTRQGLASSDEDALSPRLALQLALSDAVALHASAYRSFRAPTLNELYRSFRVGNVVTNANEALVAERLTGFELGASAAPSGSLGARATCFWMEIDEPVANVTLSETPALVTRQRRNLGRLRSRGAELEASAHVASAFTLRAAWLYTDSQVTSFPGTPSLEGLRVPQVPRHQGTLSASWSSRALTGGLQARFAGRQFEDDRNELPLSGFVALDALVSVPVVSGLSLLVAGENLLDARIEAGRTPATTLAAGRLIRGGVRIGLP
jgi:outer membrane receptor protein involved in Fe transport